MGMQDMGSERKSKVTAGRVTAYDDLIWRNTTLEEV
jgi:hypothetical protein